MNNQKKWNPIKTSKEAQRISTVRDSISRCKNRTRSIRSFYPDTISIPSDETIGVYSNTVVYTEVIDAVSGEILGIPDMEIVKATMRPSSKQESLDGEYYIANFK